MYEKIQYPKTMTIYGCSESVANQLDQMMKRGNWSHELATDFICANHIRCKELDALADSYNRKWEQTVTSLLRNPPAWVSDSDSSTWSRADAEELAFDDEYFLFTEYDARTLIKTCSSPLHFDLAIIQKYGWDVLYLLVSSHFVPRKVQKIDGNDPYRLAAERACSLNLGVQGDHIGLKDLLERLTSEKIKHLLSGVEFRKSSKKTLLIDTFLALEDAAERFSSAYPLVDSFLFNELPDEIANAGLPDAITYRDYCKQMASYLLALNCAGSRLPDFRWVNHPDGLVENYP